jgi:dynein heavy chain 2
MYTVLYFSDAQVLTLMGTDLVRHKDRWAFGVKEMRDIFVRLENEGYSRETQQVWMGFEK